jgi:hypothetical protein
MENKELSLRLAMEKEAKKAVKELSNVKTSEILTKYDGLERTIMNIRLENEELRRKVTLSHKEMERSQEFSSEVLQNENLQLKKALTTLKKESEDIRSAVERTSIEVKRLEDLEQLTNTVKDDLAKMKNQQKAIAEERERIEGVGRETVETQRRERERVSELQKVIFIGRDK